MSIEMPVVTTLSCGEAVYGILHKPDKPRSPRIGISLLNPGLKSRVAPNRLNVLLARRLTKLGYFVLRTDPPGVGDSAGELPESPFPELWQRVQSGEWVAPISEVNDLFASRCELDEIVGMGNCGGAITALLEAECNPMVRRLVLIDIPVTLVDADSDTAMEIFGREHGRKVLRSYMWRSLDWRAWCRLLTLKSDMVAIFRALRAIVIDHDQCNCRDTETLSCGRKKDTPPTNSFNDAGGLSEFFAKAFINFHNRGGRAIFIHAELNDDTFIFNRLVGDRYMVPGSELANRHQRIVISGANHIYGTYEWRSDLFKAIEDWLTSEANVAFHSSGG